MLLEAWGELEFFDCEGCQDQREYGCGTAPLTAAADTLRDLNLHKSRPRFWTRGLWYDQADMRRMPANSELASELYAFADWGSVIRATGTPWRCCPAWYARFSPRGAVDAAHHAAKLLRWRDSGALSAVSRGTLQQWEVDLVQVAEKMYQAKERRDADERREQAKATARAQGRGR